MAAADRDLTGPGPALPAAAGGVLDAWLGRLAAALPGPRRPRAAILDELRDGLHEATRARLAAGSPAGAAARAATTEFGDPATVARAFTGELAAARARMVTLALVGSGPVVGVAWLGAWLTARTASAPPIPPWRGEPVGAWAAWPLLPAAVALVGLATLLVVATTGRLGRRLPADPRVAPIAAAAAALIAAGLDAGLLGLVAASALIGGPVGGPLLPIAAAASLARLALVTRAAHGCLTQAGKLTG